MHRLTALFIVSTIVVDSRSDSSLAPAQVQAQTFTVTPQLYLRSGWRTPNGRRNDGRCRKSLWNDVLRRRWTHCRWWFGHGLQAEAFRP